MSTHTVAAGGAGASQARAGVEDASRAQRAASAVGMVAAIALAPLAIVYLSFNAGGFFPVAPGIVAIVFAMALLVRTMGPERPFEGFDWRLSLPLVAFALFAAWQLASALWSHAPARAIDEYDRTLLYLLVFAFYGSIAVDAARLRWLIRGVAGAIFVVCLIAFISRALPHVWPTQLVFASDRLSYPLTYWNTEGMLAAVGLILGFHLTSDREEHPIVRVLAASALPIVAATLLFTFSRGALGVAVVGLISYALVGRPTALLTGLVAAAPTVAIAVKSAYDATLLATRDPVSPAAIAQGHHVAVTVFACAVGAAALRGALLVPDRVLARWRPRRLARIRIPSWAVSVAAVVVALAVAVGSGAPSFINREYSRFVHGTSSQGHLTRDRLTDPFNDSRLPLWRVGMRAYRAQKLHGQGAGTYEVYFLKHRPNVPSVVDAHSLYVQVLAELGLVGFVLLLVTLVGLLVLLAVRAWGRQRAVYAALLAALLAWGIHSGVDWDWQMPAVTVWLFAAGGLALGRRRGDAQQRSGALTSVRPLVAFGWVVLAVAPFLAALSYARLQSAQTAMTSSQCATAKRDALSSLSYLSLRPEPYGVIGLCDIEQGDAVASVSAMREAESYDPNNWKYHYTLALALAADGRDPRVELRRAASLDRFEPLVQSATRKFARTGPQQWRQLAPRVAQFPLSLGL
jgi:O-Antigen ligase